jgi:phosphate uptake regulator
VANVELRKIQVTGGSTHVVSLPKKWIDRSGLTRSDTLAIHEESDGSLLIVPHGDARPRKRRVEIKINSTTASESLVRQLVGAYLAGADEIHIAADGRIEAALRKTIRKTIRDIVGVEILEENSDSVTLQDLVGVSEMDLRKTVTRMYRIARIMFDDAIEAFQTRDKVLAADVTSRDDELDRLEWHVSKQMHALLEQPRLAARLGIRPAEALNFFLVARTLERMGDHASKICKNVHNLNDLPAAPAASIMGQVELVCKVWDEGFASLKRTDFEQGSNAIDLGKQGGPWRGKFSNLTNNLDPEIVAPLTLIADSVDRVRSYAIDISETALNHTFLAK